MREFYRKVAGEDMEMDWAELKRLLDMALKRGETVVWDGIIDKGKLFSLCDDDFV